MANAAKKDIVTVDDDDPRSQWPKNAKAQVIANLSKRSLENKVRDGTAVYVYDSSGERHFDPEWLNEVSGTVSDADIEADLTKSVTEQLRRALSDMVKSNKDLLTLATGPAFKAARVVRQENRALRKRCRQLETDRIKSIEAFEAAMTATHDRELARETQRAQEARKDKGFDALMGQLPNLVSQMSGKKKVMGLLDSLSDEQKIVLAQLLSPKQMQVLASLMQQANSDTPRDEPEAKRSSSEPADPATNGASSKPAGDTQGA
jgi:hypothetical protein